MMLGFPWQEVGRKLLAVEELPQGALARYERDVAALGNAAEDIKVDETPFPRFRLLKREKNRPVSRYHSHHAYEYGSSQRSDYQKMTCALSV